MSALRVKGLGVRYGETEALRDIELAWDAGQLVGIIGPNGSGKSSLLKALMGVVPSVGRVEVMGQSGRATLKHLTYVPQRGSVDWDFPVTVRDVVRQGRYRDLGLWRRMRAADHAAVDNALRQVALSELADRQIGELSGGQQQRTFLARALAQRGDVYLLDEPFAGVDAFTERAIFDVLRALRDAGALVIVVHHDLATVSTYFDRVAMLRTTLIAEGPTAETFTTASVRETYGGNMAVFADDQFGVIM